MEAEITFDTTGLRELFKNLYKRTSVNVGVTKDKNDRDDGFQTNSQIAEVHEFGGFINGMDDEGNDVQIEIPERPIMRLAIPAFLPAKLKTYQGDIGSFTPLDPLTEFVGIKAVEVIQENFQEAGMPKKWAGIAPLTIERREARGNFDITPLDDTGQLKNSFGYEVIK